MSTKKDLSFWKANAEEDYMRVPISVLRYITELEKAVKNCSIPDTVEAFEVGIKLKITKRKHGHKFRIGEVVEIVKKGADIDGHVSWQCSNGTEKWWLEETEAERYYR